MAPGKRQGDTPPQPERDIFYYSVGGERNESYSGVTPLGEAQKLPPNAAIDNVRLTVMLVQQTHLYYLSRLTLL